MIIRWDTEGRQVHDVRWDLGKYKARDDASVRRDCLNHEKLEALRAHEDALRNDMVTTGVGRRALRPWHASELRRSLKVIVSRRAALEHRIALEQGFRDRDTEEARDYLEHNFGAIVLEAIREAEMDGVTLDTTLYSHIL